MKWRRFPAALLAAAALGGCSSDASGPGPITGEVNAIVTDPAGDSFGSGSVHWDLTSMRFTRETGDVVVSLEFSND
jgi:hypothetical protein